MTDNTEEYNEDAQETQDAQLEEAPVEIQPDNVDQVDQVDEAPEYQAPDDNIQQELQTKTEQNNANDNYQTEQDEIPKDTPPDTIVSTIPVDDGENNKKNEKNADEEIDKREDLYDADGDGIADDEMFEGSTHSFAIYFARKRNVDGLIIAYFVFLMQMTLYLVCASQVFGDLSGSEFTIPVNVRFGKKCTDATNLICPPDLPNLAYVALASVLLAFFLMHDILASLRIYTTVPGTWAKVAASIILFEALFAALIGALFAVGAQSGYDAIANCVGVLFIHDADEKAFEAFMIINSRQVREHGCIQCCGKTYKWCKFECCKYVRLAAIFLAAFIIMVLALIIGGAIRGSQKANIIDVYGDDYWDNAFSSGYFSYDWDSTNTFTWDTNF